MPAVTSRTSTTSAKRPGWFRNHRALTIVIIILAATGLTVAGWNIYQKQAIKTEKARFAQAEQDIDKLSADIIAVTGQPLKVEKKKFCSRPNLKFQEGPLSCNIDIDQFYSIDNEEGGNKIIDLSGKVINENGHNLGGDIGRSLLSAENSDNSYQKIVINYQSNIAKIPCDVIYQYFNSANNPFTGQAISNSSPNFISLSLSCHDSAKIEHYPVGT